MVPRRASSQTAKAEIKSTSRDFVEFLKTLKRPATKDIKDKCKRYT